MGSLQNNNIYSTPETIQNNNNFLKDTINQQGFMFDSPCVLVVLSNLVDNFSEYIINQGNYNTVAAFKPIWTPPTSYTQKNYSVPCPNGWTYNSSNQGCTNQNYQGSCPSGKLIQVPSTPYCPNKNVGNPSQYTDGQWDWSWWDWNWNWDSWSYPNNNSYVGWNGPTDASTFDLSNTNIGNQSYGAGTICTAGWSAGNSQGGSQADCNNSGGQFVTYYDDPTYGSHGYTCFTPTQFNSTQQPPSYFTGDKSYWEGNCGVNWPEETINVPGYYTCQYPTNNNGSLLSITNDIATGNIFQINGSAATPGEAAKIALLSKRMQNPFFFMIGNNIYVSGNNNDSTIFTSKGPYQENCTENNNQMGTLYQINDDFFKKISQCSSVNMAINDINKERVILQNSVSSNVIKENFGSGEIVTNLNDIINNLKNNYNKKAELYNLQVDVINNNDKIVENKNSKLNKQLDTMNQIQEQIALKSRVIELNNDSYNKQLFNKKLLIGFFVLLPFLGIPLLLVFLNAISPLVGIGMGGLIIFGYVIYIIVIYKKNSIKKFIKPLIKKISKYEKAIQNYWDKNIEQDCGCSTAEEEELKSENQENTNDGNYLMKTNGPFYYYDGSAPPQQIYPEAIGTIEVNVEGINYKFPEEKNTLMNNIKNPISNVFFDNWLQLLWNQIGENFWTRNEFNEKLDVIDFTDTNDNLLPFWENIKLPMITNLEQTVNSIIQSYLSKNEVDANDVSTILINIWNFMFGDQIPNNIYKEWINKFDNKNTQQFYYNFIYFIFSTKQFTDKYGDDPIKGYDNFSNTMYRKFYKTFNKKIILSEPVSKKIK